MNNIMTRKIFKLLMLCILIQVITVINVNLFCVCNQKPVIVYRDMMPEETHETKWPHKIQRLKSVENDADILTRDLNEKLSRPPPRRKVTLPNACRKQETLANSCDKKCLQMEIPQNVSQRVAQIVNPKHLRMRSEHHEILREMSEKVKGKYDVIIMTSASSSYYSQSQALLKNLHEVVFPHLKNFTLLYYNLGLTSKERSQVVKYCKCQVVDFPFEKFPGFFQNLKCYTWKPVIIKAHIGQANTLVWLDASARFHKGPHAFDALVKRTKEHGLQFPGPDGIDAAFHTMPSMYHFFGDEPCAYLTMGEVYATLGFFSGNFFVERLFLEPWVACALDKRCMCPVPYPPLSAHQSNRMIADYKAGRGSVKYGLVHRFDQSALSLLIQKVYRDRYKDVLFALDNYMSILRGDGANYFPQS